MKSAGRRHISRVTARCRRCWTLSHISEARSPGLHARRGPLAEAAETETAEIRRFTTRTRSSDASPVLYLYRLLNKKLDGDNISTYCEVSWLSSASYDVGYAWPN